MVSIADVKVSQDLRNADIYLSFYNKGDSFDPKVYFDELRKNTSNIKYKLGLALKLKYMPKIKFLLSDEYEYYDKINRILKDNG
tara:strand:- start:5601 stop:5852 length:252 start_codon:yes stop_codon:yes gene_type:complete